MLTIGTGIGGGLILSGELYRGAIGAGAELGHMVIDLDGPPCQGNCPNHGCLEALASGTALAREARRIAQRATDTALGRALADGREITGALVTELAHDGDEAAVEALALIGAQPRRRDRELREHLQPRGHRVGGGVIAAGELLLAPARAEVRGARAAAEARPRADRARALRRRGRR